MQEKIMTPEQVAQTLQVHPFTVLKFIKQGKLKASKLGRVYRIREGDLESFLEQSSSRSNRTAETDLKEVKKSKNKNKIPQNNIEEPSLASAVTKESTVAPEEGVIADATVQVSRVDIIETSESEPRSGGEDEYYILQ